jgi:DNA-binding NarL/FixJ family response regulator
MIARVLVVEDYEDWRNQVRFLLRLRQELQVVCEASDGLVAVQKAEELKPDLVLLDIGLPGLNGIEVARRMRLVSPNSKIVFLTTENSSDVKQVAFSTGAQGFVNKGRAVSELLPAIDAVLQGEQFVTGCAEA